MKKYISDIITHQPGKIITSDTLGRLLLKTFLNDTKERKNVKVRN